MRITEKILKKVVDRINRTTENPLTPYAKTKEGELIGQIGNYHLDFAYGGVKLCQMVSEGGGVRDVLSCGFTTKRDLYNQIHAYLNGVNDFKLTS